MALNKPFWYSLPGLLSCAEEDINDIGGTDSVEAPFVDIWLWLALNTRRVQQVVYCALAAASCTTR